ncbi:hypothetical protein Mro03_80980 [Microbispora rosea subsp. rosea]|nr:hypothetical protein Mro03_80980 [Microbispora rosea subsp. rosea]
MTALSRADASVFLLIIMSGRRQGLMQAAGGAAVPFTVDPKVVEPPAATERLREKRTRGGRSA